MNKTELSDDRYSQSTAVVQDISDEGAASVSGGALTLRVELLRNRKGRLYGKSTLHNVRRRTLYNFSGDSGYYNDNIKELLSPDGDVMVYEHFWGKGRSSRIRKGQWTEIRNSKPQLKQKIKHKNFGMSSFKVL